MSSTVASTKESVRIIQRRGSVFLSRSDGGGRIDFNSQGSMDTTRLSGLSGEGIETSTRIGVRRPSVRGSSGGSGINSEGRNVEGGSETGRSGEHQAEEKDRDSTAAAKIGNILAELPLSKIKIAIGKFLQNEQNTIQIIMITINYRRSFESDPVFAVLRCCVVTASTFYSTNVCARTVPCTVDSTQKTRPRSGGSSKFGIYRTQTI